MSSARPRRHTDVGLDVERSLDWLSDELRVIADILDEMRTDLRWGIENGRVIFSLTECGNPQQIADVTVECEPVILAIRLQQALAALQSDLALAIAEKRPVGRSGGDSVTRRTVQGSLFEGE